VQHIRLKFGEIRFINQGFITENSLDGHFFPKFREPLSQKLDVRSHGINDTDVLYPPAKFGGDRFIHGDTRTKIRVFVFHFRLFVTLGVA